MKIKLVGLMLFLISISAWSAQYSIVLEKAPINIYDKNSIKRGAKFFANNCMICHTLIYLRYDPLAKNAGVSYDRMPIHVTTWPFGVKPPDLSLEASIRGVNWIYTYLHSFYDDPSSPTGVNNLLFPNTKMAGILTRFQGKQILAAQENLKASHMLYLQQYNWYGLLILESQGSMSPKEFDQTITDVVNFLNYAAAPYERAQHLIGYWVICFLFGFFILAYLLKKSYWKDV